MRKCSALLVALLAIALSLSLQAAAPAVAAGPSAAPASPAVAAKAAPGRVFGEILGARGAGSPRVKLTWFTRDWKRLGARSFIGGGYSMSLPAGVYRLQFTDLRPTYDVKRYAPADALVRVTAGGNTFRTVRMRAGAAIGGTVKAGGKVAPYAKVVAATADERSFSTVADRRGNFALGGLPAASYSVFTYDKRAQWTGRSTYLRNLKGGTYRPLAINLPTRAGSLFVNLKTGSTPFRGAAYPTVVSRVTGQFWTAKASRGGVTFRGLAPGRYRIQLPWLGNYLPVTVNLRPVVRAGRLSFATVRVNRRGAWVTGTAVDANRPENVLEGARVRLYDASGAVRDETKTNANGRFVLDGQLTTQQGMRVVIGPGQYSEYLGEGVSYCKYRSTTTDGFEVTTGREAALGSIGVDHLADDDQDGEQCHTPAPAPAPTSTQGATR